MTDPATRLGYLIADMRRVHGRVFDRMAAPLGLTHVQWRVLKRLQAEQGLTQAGLAEALEMEPIAIGRLLDRLQKAGFVERRADPADRRCWRLYLGAHSAPVIAQVDAIAEQLRAQSLHGTDPAQLAQVMAVLGQVLDNLSSIDHQQRN